MVVGRAELPAIFEETMEATQQDKPKRVPNSWMTVLVATSLTLGGIVGAAIAVGDLGMRPGDWPANMPVAAPGLGAAVLALLSGISLGFAQRRAVLFLWLGLAWSIFCSVMTRYGWAKPDPSHSHGFALLYALYLLYNGRLHPSRPGNPPEAEIISPRGLAR